MEPGLEERRNRRFIECSRLCIAKLADSRYFRLEVKRCRGN